jgi:hypothetical protein
MKKTIFYIPSDTEQGDYWFNGKPHKQLLVLEDYLYEPNSSIVKEITVGKYVKGLTVTGVQDRFSEEGIIRRIAFHKSV